jgi:hypothetical protein
MIIAIEREDCYLEFITDPNINEDSILKGSSTTLTFKYKVRGIYRYFIVYKSEKLLFAKLVGKNKKMMTLTDDNHLLIRFAILSLNIGINKNPEYQYIMHDFMNTLIEIIKEDSK